MFFFFNAKLFNQLELLCNSQKDYVCFDFVPQHHNVIRYRRGLAVIKNDFHTVCSWVQFPNAQRWKYNLFLGMFEILPSIF